MEWLLFFGAALASWGFCHPVGYLLRRLQMWDKPNERSSHQKPTLRGGGLAVILVIVLAIAGWVPPANAILAYTWLAALAVLGWINFLDDRGHVRKRYRLAAQIFSAIIVLAALGYPPLLILLVGFLLTAFTNFVNFLDGINGLAAGQLLLIIAGTALLYGQHTEFRESSKLLLMLVFAGALAGFLPFNFPQAVMFLGDVGSVLLGFSCGVLVIWLGQSDPQLFHVLVPLGAYFFLDGGITLLRRVLAGENWLMSHREHYYQRLIRMGWSHQRTSVVIWLAQILITLILWQALEANAHNFWFWIVPTVIWGILFAAIEIKFRKFQTVTD